MYELADKTLKSLNIEIVKRFQWARRHDYDELNVLKQLYNGLASDAEKAYLDLAIAQYEDMGGEDCPDLDWILALLDEYDPVTRYRFTTETERKRDRLFEAVHSVAGARQRKQELDRAMRYWADQARQYADIVTDAVMIKAYEDAGVKKVRWHTQEDGNVCRECRKLNGKVFDIDKRPPKFHWRCRCYYEPVRE